MTSATPSGPAWPPPGFLCGPLQEWMGHRDSKTTEIYADYQPGGQEAELVERAFSQTGSGSAESWGDGSPNLRQDGAS
jgi:hypothetical protein